MSFLTQEEFQYVKDTLGYRLYQPDCNIQSILDHTTYKDFVFSEQLFTLEAGMSELPNKLVQQFNHSNNR